MGAGRSMYPLIQINSIHKLFEFIHLRVYSTQPIIIRIVLVQISNLNFATRKLVDSTN